MLRTHLIIGTLIFSPAVASAQSAWVGPGGSAEASVGFQQTYTNGNYGNLEERGTLAFEELETFSVQTVFLGADYSITDNLAVSASLPWSRVKFTGDVTFLPHGPEDGDHEPFSTFTDLTTYARYSFNLSDNLSIAPLVGVNLPVQDYVVNGHALPGKGLWDIRGGVAGGYVNSSLFFQLRGLYRFTEVVEPYERFDMDVINGTATAGYFVLDNLTVYASGDYRYTMGGNTFQELGPIVGKALAGEMLTEREATIFANHDQATQEKGFVAFGGLSYQFLPYLRADAGYWKTIFGDSMQAAQGLNLQLAYVFVPDTN